MEEEQKNIKATGHGTTSLELIKLKGEVDTLEVKMEEAKKHAADIRAAVRKMKFEGVKEGENYTFYPKGAIPAGVQTDGNTWRIRIRNASALDTAKVKVMGGGDVVGDIPKGLPKFTIPQLTLASFLKVLPSAVIIALLGFMEAIAIAKAMAAKTGQKIDPNQELIGQGLANMLGSLTSSFATSGSFSRSAVNLQAGAVSGISAVVTSLMVVATLLFFTPLLYHLPQAVLAAVIMMAVVGLINIKGFAHAWKAQWYDGAISVLSFLVTLYFAPHLDKGIMVGVGLSMACFPVQINAAGGGQPVHA